MTLHDAEELDNDLGARADHHLALSGLLGVVDGVERIVKNGGLGHFGGCQRFSGGDCGLRCLLNDTWSAFRSHKRKECPSVRNQRVLQLVRER